MPSKKSHAGANKLTRTAPKGRAKTRPTASRADGSTVYQVKITLNNVNPPIWRRAQTRDCTLATLHNLIQVSMGWEESHLHLFEIGGDRYGDPAQWPREFADEPDTLNQRRLKLGQLVAQGTTKFSYEYDMGDGWRHTIEIEKTLPAEAGVTYPRCIEGERACPPEDCGGAWGYGDLLKAIADPKHERHDELLDWFGSEFDPEKFDLERTNRALQTVE